MIELTEKIKDMSENGLKRIVDCLLSEKELDWDCTSVLFIQKNYGVYVHRPIEEEHADYEMTILGDLSEERRTQEIRKYCESDGNGAIIFVEDNKLIITKVDDINRGKTKHIIKKQFLYQTSCGSGPVMNCTCHHIKTYEDCIKTQDNLVKFRQKLNFN